MRKLVVLFSILCCLWPFTFVALYSYHPQCSSLVYEYKVARYEVVTHDFLKIMGKGKFISEDVYELNNATKFNVFAKELSMSIDFIIRKFDNICQVEFRNYKKMGVDEGGGILSNMSKKELSDFRNYVEENLLAQVDDDFTLDEKQLPKLRRSALLSKYAPSFIIGYSIFLLFFGGILFFHGKPRIAKKQN
jgi:hypothetical protein